MPETPRIGGEVFDFNVINGPLHEVLETIENLLDRSITSRSELQGNLRAFLLSLFRVNRNLFRTVISLCAERRVADGLDEKSCLSAGPLNRVLVDSFLTLVFILDNPTERLPRYMRAGWGEMCEDRDLMAEEFPDFEEGRAYSSTILARLIDKGIAMLRITPDEQKEILSKRQRWPNPSKMPTLINGEASPKAKRLLTRYRNLIYSDLSQEAHLSFFGLMRMGAFFVKPTEDERQEFLQGWIAKNAFLGVSLILAIASAIDEYLRLGAGDRIRTVWEVTGSGSEIAKLLCRLRYESEGLFSHTFEAL